jgi:hypothetical protein
MVIRGRTSEKTPNVITLLYERPLLSGEEGVVIQCRLGTFLRPAISLLKANASSFSRAAAFRFEVSNLSSTPLCHFLRGRKVARS